MDHSKSIIAAHVVPEPDILSTARSSIITALPLTGLGLDRLSDHLNTSIRPGLSSSSTSSRYYGFVTGGSTPAALLADNLVTEADQNVGVHLPDQSVATDVEDAALRMLCELLDLNQDEWRHRTFTTGATASNIVGLACGREYVVAKAGGSVAEQGLFHAMRASGLDDVKVLTSAPHSSIAKACAIVALGHDAIVDVSSDRQSWRLDLDKLESALQRQRTGCIISISCSEVNSGLFATNGTKEMQRVRELADKYSAWVHVDAAFGLLARILPDDEEFGVIRNGTGGIELADSIAGDAHKLFNVPYDCGIFFSRHLDLATRVFGNPGAPYLATSSAAIPSPLNIGIENSRRFRALPVYANLVAYGRTGYVEMLQRQVRMSRRIAEYLDQSEHFELLPSKEVLKPGLQSVFVIVLFRAKSAVRNETLIHAINKQRVIYCSGTKWQGKPAVRFAVSNWQADVNHDWPAARQVLERSMESQ